MNSKAIIASSVILLLLLGILGLQLGKNDHIETPSVSATDRYPFKTLVFGEIDSFSIQSENTTLTLKKIKLESSHYFGIVEKNNYPADGLLIHNFLQSLQETTLIRKVPLNEKFLQDCGLEKSSAVKKITLYKTDNSPLTQFTLGKEASTGGHFILFEKKPFIYLSEYSLRLPKVLSVWEDLRFPQIISKYIRKITFSFPREEKTQASCTLERTSEDAPLKFTANEFSKENTHYLVHFLTQLEVAQLVNLTSEETGLQTPVQKVTFQLRGDAIITASLGNVLPWTKDDQKRRRYVALDFKISQESPEDLKAIYYDWKKRSGNHIFLLKESQDFQLLNFQAPILGNLENIKAFSFTQKEKSVHFEKKENRWNVLNGYNFPANEEKLFTLLDELRMMKSRPGDIANPGVNLAQYEDTLEGNIEFSFTLEDGTQKTLTQCKRRQGVEIQEPEYQRVFSIDDVCNISDEWGNYYIKPSGSLTLGSRGTNELQVFPKSWLYQTLAEFPENDIAEIQWKSPHQTLAWIPNPAGKLELTTPTPTTTPIPSEKLISWLKEVKANDLVRADETEQIKSFETASTKLALTIKNKKGLQLSLQFKTIDAYGNIFGSTTASYVPPSIPPTPLEIAQKEYDQLNIDVQKTEKLFQEFSASTTEALTQSTALQEQIHTLTQKIVDQNATLETLPKEDENSKEARELLTQEINALTTQKIASEEKLTDLFNATQELKKKAEEQQALFEKNKTAQNEKKNQIASLQKEEQENQEELEETKKAREQEAQQIQKLVADINNTFGTRILAFNPESAFNLFILQETSPNYPQTALQKISLQQGELSLTLSNTTNGWKIGEEFASLEKIQSLLTSLEKLELRQGYNTPPIENPEVTITLDHSPQKTVYKLSKPFTVKVDLETHTYRQIQWNENTFIVPEEALKLDFTLENWQDLRLVRLNIKDFQTVSLEYPDLQRTHSFLVKDGKFTFPDLVPNHVMSDVGLEESIKQLLDSLKLDTFVEKPTDSSVALKNKMILKHPLGEVRILFSNLSETEESVFLQLQISGTPDAERLKPLLEKKWYSAEKHFFENFILPREELETLQVYVSHILVSWKGCERSRSTRTQEEAKKRIQEAEQKLKDPQAHFAELAKEYSDEPGAKQTGGILPFPLQKDTEDYDPVFRDAALLLKKVGERSPIIETKFGFHILKRDQ